MILRILKGEMPFEMGKIIYNIIIIPENQKTILGFNRKFR